MSLQLCGDITEAVDLCERYNLYLKPCWKVKISVQLPVIKATNQSISSWKVMEKLRNMIKPEDFVSLKVCKTNLVVMQFEGELEKKTTFNRVLQRLQTNTMKLGGFPDVLKIRAAVAKLNYPSRHDWDSFFRDAKNVNEMRPGERPDTVYIQNIPTKWFLEKNSSSKKPSEYILKKVFESFGEIRRLAVPSNKEGSLETFPKLRSFDGELVFDLYVQYKEYISFVKAMDALRGMKLLYKSDNGKAYLADIKVDFDRTRYLSDRSIKLRSLEEKEKNVKPGDFTSVVVTKEADESTTELSTKLSSSKWKTSEEEQFPKLNKYGEEKLRKLKTCRECGAKRLLKELLNKTEGEELLKRAKEKEEQIALERLKQQELLQRAEEEEKKRKEEEEKLRQKYLAEQEKRLREKLLKSLKSREQKKTEEAREKLRKEIAGRNVLKSVLVVHRSRHKECDDAPHTSKRFRS